MKDEGSRETGEGKGENERETEREIQEKKRKYDERHQNSQLEESISFLFRQGFFRIASDRADVILIALLAI